MEEGKQSSLQKFRKIAGITQEEFAQKGFLCAQSNNMSNIRKTSMWLLFRQSAIWPQF